MMNPKVIAEIGCNHQGSVSTAIQMITAAAKAGAWGVKFQKRNPEFLSYSRYTEAHKNPDHSFGINYGAHRKALEFNGPSHSLLAYHARHMGVHYGCSVWDVESAAQILAVSPDWVKIPSAHNQDFGLMGFVAEYAECPIHISLGALDKEGLASLHKFWTQKGGRVVYYACTSSYPAEQSHLLEIPLIAGVKGFSGHHRGIALDVAAFTLGAEFIERHFTLDKTQKGSDHALSLEPDELKKLVDALETVSANMVEKPDTLPESEREYARMHKWTA